MERKKREDRRGKLKTKAIGVNSIVKTTRDNKNIPEHNILAVRKDREIGKASSKK
ncbi:hypothetical protein C5167_002909 [Papaver somniferum]|uniref:Uncharacterized protein n=1 Tax=Papaver somniferum TaxID=3469 RepID=A0A4Y7L265_PAPSO|nr:hypothetical protein C5167_002909 [Papaver somniferum]